LNLKCPLEIAISCDSIEILKWLLKAGADPNVCSEVTVKPNKKRVLLDLPTASFCSFEFISHSPFLLQCGLLPIEIAAMQGKTEIMEMLFPLTSQVPEVQSWSVRGILQYVKSNAFEKEVYDL
jgi:ankyrin repeat protein